MSHFSKLGFILATLGSSIGLGHIWRFPYMAGESGGAAFILLYLVLSIIVGGSILLAEMLLGNKARSNPMDNYIILNHLNTLPPEQAPHGHTHIQDGENKKLMWLGINAIAGPLILSFYAVVMGWIVYYLGFVSFHLPASIDEAKTIFENIRTHSLLWQTICFGIIILITALVVARGIKKGIELLNLVLMPLLFIIFIGLLIYAMSLAEFHQARTFMFSFNPSDITLNTIIEALGQVFFSLSLGVGTIAVYAASARHDENLLKSSLWVVCSGIIVSLIAGLMIFTFIYHFGGVPSEGQGLLLISLPLAFQALGTSGQIISVLFFIAVLFAGITSTVSMLEPGVSILRDKFSLSQAKASILLSLVVFTLGFLVILWANVDIALPMLFGKPLFNWLDSITSSLLMPIGALITLLFLGYGMKSSHLRAWTPYMPSWLFYIWLWTIRFIAPAIVLIILLSKWWGHS